MDVKYLAVIVLILSPVLAQGTVTPSSFCGKSTGADLYVKEYKSCDLSATASHSLSNATNVKLKLTSGGGTVYSSPQTLDPGQSGTFSLTQSGYSHRKVTYTAALVKADTGEEIASSQFVVYYVATPSISVWDVPSTVSAQAGGSQTFSISVKNLAYDYTGDPDAPAFDVYVTAEHNGNVIGTSSSISTLMEDKTDTVDLTINVPSQAGTKWVYIYAYGKDVDGNKISSSSYQTVQVNIVGCGDGTCTPDECASGCTEDCSAGQCSNNGQCDTVFNENCQNNPSECPCGVGSLCQPYRPGTGTDGCYRIRCGDGACDSPTESSDTCCDDCPCPREQKCDHTSHHCVECMSDADCESRRCNMKTHLCVECTFDTDCDADWTEWSGINVCSVDKSQVIERGTFYDYKCAEGRCTHTETEKTRTVDDCNNTLCYGDSCGCPEGWKACMQSRICEEIAGKAANTPCACNFECESGYCENGVCSQAGVAQLSTTKPQSAVGEEVGATLSVTNPLNQEIDATLILNLGSGFTIGGALAQSCTGNQCTTTVKLPSKGVKHIEISYTGQQVGTTQLEFVVKYTVQGETVEQKDSVQLEFSSCGDGKCTGGENTANCCLDCQCEQGDICNRGTKACEKFDLGAVITSATVFPMVAYGTVTFFISLAAVAVILWKIESSM